ncbi:MAG: type II toxin-antitoxin system VapC family toxin [Thermodesulfobacteriota bacterium]
MVYVDTSVMVKLYIKEAHSQEVSAWIRENDEAIPKTTFHELEFTNAIKLKQFRNEMTSSEAETVLSRFSQHETDGIFYRPTINWPDAIARSLTLSRNHTETIGSRSLDLIHVALALSMGAERFFTLDEKQSQLASAAGLQTVNCATSTPMT